MEREKRDRTQRGEQDVRGDEGKEGRRAEWRRGAAKRRRAGQEG